MTSNNYTINPIGYIRTPFADKFGIPRQPSLAPHATGTLKLIAPYNHADCVRGLADFSHVWLSFIFHEVAGQWSPMVRPPRLGGNEKIGVFASRSPFRPNSLGLSLVQLVKIDTHHGVTLHFSGLDLVDQTPIIDIKPYIPFVECQTDAKAGFVTGQPPRLNVEFSELALQQISNAPYENLFGLITEVLAQDPRPAYASDPYRTYGIRIYQYDIQWRCDGSSAYVLALELA
ncbi:tRNA (N6-threonylcarbamoyladenosine(37)-N6)-methyltransferase TrmO [Deefgea tanakiae]|uniref:tRNA (N6-threonylcarbamoyladenosine(37)-N6)-methyltransferase TrmO n=1 Tax=Deefgea tanakiae TaxID=2865840 RepID=A0ABX8ZE08_9NEIS|nr:tRNA (N6-threonylcarbamoyladenosine(37)-N6)-methyltransferase TrmO [Deefgea tanakiae]QZA79114.1 tRNA (N6-threonylcarbamoyladenosine(37)-N6)-methyltransferase TrmO [Deefgea tanakiae]